MKNILYIGLLSLILIGAAIFTVSWHISQPDMTYCVKTIASPIFGERPVIDGLYLDVYSDRIEIGTRGVQPKSDNTYEIKHIDDTLINNVPVVFYYVIQTKGTPTRVGNDKYIIGLTSDFAAFFQDRGVLFILMFEKNENERFDNGSKGKKQSLQRTGGSLQEGKKVRGLYRDNAIRGESEPGFVRYVDEYPERY